MTARPRWTERSEALRLASWNAGVHGMKLELGLFLRQHTDDIYLLKKTFLKPGKACRLSDYVFHRTDRPTAGAGQQSWSAVV